MHFLEEKPNYLRSPYTMRDNRKKIVSLTVAAACLASAFAFTACGEKARSLDEKLSYTSATAAATSNGGFAVEKDGFVY